MTNGTSRKVRIAMEVKNSDMQIVCYDSISTGAPESTGYSKSRFSTISRAAASERYHRKVSNFKGKLRRVAGFAIEGNILRSAWLRIVICIISLAFGLIG
jgi:hypothetical protein